MRAPSTHLVPLILLLALAACDRAGPTGVAPAPPEAGRLAVPAVQTVDQAFFTNPSSWSQICSGQGGWNGMIFTPTVDHITGFDIFFYNAGGASAFGVVFSVTAWPNTASILGTAPPSTTHDGLVHFDLPAPVPLVPGQKYALMRTGGNNTCFKTAYYDPSYFYPYGGAVTWYGAEEAGVDISFRTYYDAIPDADGDGVEDGADNCPAAANADQTDTDADGSGDACDDDDDGDGHADLDELAAGSDPLDPFSTPEICDGMDNDLDGAVDEGSPDTDGDGVKDCLDADDDGDGIADEVDEAPLDAFNERFSDLPLGGATAGTILERGGFDLAIGEAPNPDGVVADVTGAGSTVLIRLDGKSSVIRLRQGTYVLTDPAYTSTLSVGSGGPAEIDLTLNGAAVLIVVHAGGSVTWTESLDEDGNLVGLTIDAVVGTVTVNGSAALTGPVGVGIGPPTNRDQCRQDGWAAFTLPRAFRNQGDCIQFVNTGK